MVLFTLFTRVSGRRDTGLFACRSKDEHLFGGGFAPKGRKPATKKRVKYRHNNRKKYSASSASLRLKTTVLHTIAATLSRNTWVCKSTSSSLVSGEISAMLWNGVIKIPRLSAARCI